MGVVRSPVEEEGNRMTGVVGLEAVPVTAAWRQAWIAAISSSSEPYLGQSGGHDGGRPMCLFKHVHNERSAVCAKTKG